MTNPKPQSNDDECFDHFFESKCDKQYVGVCRRGIGENPAYRFVLEMNLEDLNLIMVSLATMINDTKIVEIQKDKPPPQAKLLNLLISAYEMFMRALSQQHSENWTKCIGDNEKIKESTDLNAGLIGTIYLRAYTDGMPNISEMENPNSQCQLTPGGVIVDTV